MTAPASARSVLAPFERLAALLADPVRGDRTAALVLVGYVAVWTLYAVLAKGSQDIHFDMGEAVAWSREIWLGTPKHPPLSAWVAGLWFAVFPLTDWAYYLLAVVVGASGLAIAWALSGHYLDGDKRVAGLALMTLVPFFNFHALKFNANSVLIPVWGLTTLAFLRAFETRSIAWAALAGVAAALAMLGKYWSIVLLIGLGLAALADPRRGAYLRSPAPWVTIAAGAAVLAPHIWWLAASSFAPFGYALAVHAAPGLGAVAMSVLGFLGGVAGYLAAPVVLALLAARPSAAALADTLWPQTPARRLAMASFVFPLVIPVVIALATRAEIVSLWAIGTATLLPVVLLSSPHVAVPRRQAARLLALALVVPVVLTAAAPVIAVVIHRQGVANYATHYRAVAAEAERAWRETSDRPLGAIGSYTNLVNGVVFYLAGRPATYDVTDPRHTPWVDDARIARGGIVLVCPVRETSCVAAATAATRRVAIRREVEITRTHLGVTDKPARYLIVTIPPQDAPR